YHVIASRDGYNFEPGDLGLAFMSENLNLSFTARPTNPRPIKDFDGDGRTDLVVYRPSEGTWYVRNSQTGSVRAERFGLAGDLPMAADLTGDSWPDMAVFRPSSGTWYWLNNRDNEMHAMQFGLSGDVAIPADYDGDGRLEPAVYRGGTWYIASPDSSANAFQF